MVESARDAHVNKCCRFQKPNTCEEEGRKHQHFYRKQSAYCAPTGCHRVFNTSDQAINLCCRDRIVMRRRTRFSLNSRNFGVLLLLLLLCSIFLCFPSGGFSAGVVTLKSIQIFNTHEFIWKPTVYFLCREENKTFLPDVKEPHFLYTFKGEESWQPLTELENKKCKRCGFYEKDTIKQDDVFDEWEFCPSDFTTPDGKYVRFKDKEFNATFLCPKCVPLEMGSDHASDNEVAKGKGTHVVLVIVITVLVSAVSIIGGVIAYRYWQRKRRAQDRARFLQLFEDDDDIDDELGLHHGI